jgi:hypothetical protein
MNKTSSQIAETVLEKLARLGGVELAMGAGLTGLTGLMGYGLYDAHKKEQAQRQQQMQQAGQSAVAKYKAQQAGMQQPQAPMQRPLR